MNGDFHQNEGGGDYDGAFHRLSNEMHDSLLTFALSVSPQVRKVEKVALDMQRDAKQKKLKQLRDRKVLAVQTRYANALRYLDMFHSPACWNTRA